MTAAIESTGGNDDPRRMRELVSRACALAREHQVTSVVVGISAPEGDLVFPEIVDYLASALRVDDGVFRMTRERAVLLLADVDRKAADDIVRRNLAGFRASFPSTAEPVVYLGFFEIAPPQPELSVKDVLPPLFCQDGPVEPEL